MKTLAVLGLALFALVLYAMRDIPPEPDKEPTYFRSDIVAYDWEEDRNITKSMADTMVFTGGKWHNRSQLPKGRDQSLTPGVPSNEPLTEDDVREIIELNQSR
jgi:hypothetical protein